MDLFICSLESSYLLFSFYPPHLCVGLWNKRRPGMVYKTLSRRQPIWPSVISRDCRGMGAPCLQLLWGRETPGAAWGGRGLHWQGSAGLPALHRGAETPATVATLAPVRLRPSPPLSGPGQGCKYQNNNIDLSPTDLEIQVIPLSLPWQLLQVSYAEYIPSRHLPYFQLDVLTKISNMKLVHDMLLKQKF